MTAIVGGRRFPLWFIGVQPYRLGTLGYLAAGITTRSTLLAAGEHRLRAPRSIVFGVGVFAQLPAIVAERGSRVLVCVGSALYKQPTVAATLAMIGNNETVRIFDSGEPDLPLASAVRGMEFARQEPVDVVVGIGGGSTLDLAKLMAIALASEDAIETFYGENRVPPLSVPIVAVPTTAGTGSEVTPVAVVHDTIRETKVGISSPYLVSDVALCDPALALTCPPQVTAHSGIDALLHAVEAFTARTRVPSSRDGGPEPVFRGKGLFTDLFAREAIERIGSALELAVGDGRNLEARSTMALGSLCAGLACGNAGTAAVHALQYPLGAATGTPHGLGIGLLAPYVLERVRPGCTPELADVARLLGAAAPDDNDEHASRCAVDEIARLANAIGIPQSLSEIGVERRDLPHLAEGAAGIERLMRNSPVPLDRADLLAILERAWVGSRDL